MTRQQRILRDLLKAAVDNIMLLPSDHPALEPSLKLLTDFVNRRSEEIAEDRG